jgi:hypothetical protein
MSARRGRTRRRGLFRGSAEYQQRTDRQFPVLVARPKGREWTRRYTGAPVEHLIIRPTSFVLHFARQQLKRTSKSPVGLDCLPLARTR